MAEESEPGEPRSNNGLSRPDADERRRCRPRSASCRLTTSFRHCARSLITFSRRIIDARFLCTRWGTISGSRGLAPAFALELSRVRTRSKAGVLLSLRIAAASRSGQSERFTNSYSASVTSRGAPSRVRFVVESGRATRSIGFSSSAAGVPADSRKSWSDSATLRPMPTVEGPGCGGSSVAGDDVVEEPEDERREREVAARVCSLVAVQDV